MRQFLQVVGRVLFFVGWPAFWMYHRVVPGRTRVVLVHGSKVLAMKQWISDGMWGLPGGGLHKGEDPADGAAREVYEETGIKINPDKLWPLGKAVHRRYGLRFEYHMFAAAVSSSKVHAQWYEVAELAWKRPEDLRRSDTSLDALNVLRVVRSKTSLLQ